MPSNFHGSSQCAARHFQVGSCNVEDSDLWHHENIRFGQSEVAAAATSNNLNVLTFFLREYALVEEAVAMLRSGQSAVKEQPLRMGRAGAAAPALDATR